MAVVESPLPERRRIIDRPSRADRLFDRATFVAGLFVLVMLTLVGVFLFLQSRKALHVGGLGSFLTTVPWRTDVKPPEIGVLGMLTGTMTVAAIAIVIALPVSVGTALFISEYAPPRHRRKLTAVVDLLAAVPALLFGIWGFLFLSDKVQPVSRWIGDHFGFVPLLGTSAGSRYGQSIFIAGVVVSLMALPIITSITCEVFRQVPAAEKEAAYALGATRWGMIRTVVLTYGRGGIIGATMLGLGRALGETVAVVLLLPQVPQVVSKVLQTGGATIAGFITSRAGSDAFTTSGLMAAGLVLFCLTLVTNMVASIVVNRSRSGSGVEL